MPLTTAVYRSGTKILGLRTTTSSSDYTLLLASKIPSKVPLEKALPQPLAEWPAEGGCLRGSNAKVVDLGRWKSLTSADTVYDLHRFAE